MSRASRRYTRTSISLPSTVGQGVVEYVIQGVCEAQETINTFYFLGPTALPTVASLNTLLSNIHTGLWAKYLACLSVDWTSTLERLNVVTTQVIQGVVSTTFANAAGTRPTAHLPLQNAILVTRQTATKGQHGRGRIYLPAVCEGDCTNSRVTNAALQTALNALAAQMLLTYSDGTNTWTPCVAQRSTVSPRLVTNAQALSSTGVNLLIATIRRRRIGRGK